MTAFYVCMDILLSQIMQERFNRSPVSLLAQVTTETQQCAL